MDKTKVKPQELEERTLKFAAQIISFCSTLPKNASNGVLTKQLIRSASSIGANYVEANNASSKLDFKNKIYIAKKEASEARYWLRLMSRTNSVSTDGLVDEVTQLVLIFQKIVSTMKNGK